MAYHLGRLLQDGFGYQAIAVGTRRDQASLFDYPLPMPSVTVEEMTAQAAPEDVLICNAFFPMRSTDSGCPAGKSRMCRASEHSRSLMFFWTTMFLSRMGSAALFGVSTASTGRSYQLSFVGNCFAVPYLGDIDALRWSSVRESMTAWCLLGSGTSTKAFTPAMIFHSTLCP